MSDPSGAEMRSPDWTCEAMRSHGPCHHVNPGEDDNCHACGNDRPQVSPRSSGGAPPSELARVQAVKLVADFSAAVVTEEAMLGNPNVPLVKCDAYRERRMAAEAALLAALCGETTAPAAVPRDLKSGPAGDPGETK